MTLLNWWDWVIKGNVPSSLERLHLEPRAHHVRSWTVQKLPCCEETKPHGRATCRHLGLQSWSATHPSPGTRHLREDASSCQLTTSFGPSLLRSQTSQSREEPSCCVLPRFLTHRTHKHDKMIALSHLSSGIICYTAKRTRTLLLLYSRHSPWLCFSSCWKASFHHVGFL